MEKAAFRFEANDQEKKFAKSDSEIRAINRLIKNAKKSRANANTSSGRSGYQRHPKPPFSYIALIAMAIRDSPKGKLTLAEINEYLMRKFAFFRGDYQGWKNSIRHNLSLNECFVKILRDPNRPWGKDNYWALNLSSEYTFADGMFRRRRKKINNLNSSTDSAIDHPRSIAKFDQADETEASGKIKSMQNIRRGGDSFSIENLLRKDNVDRGHSKNVGFGCFGVANWGNPFPSNFVQNANASTGSANFSAFVPAYPPFYYPGPAVGFILPNRCVP